MSIRVFKGSPRWKDGIPRNSKIKIEVLPSQTIVYQSDRVAKEVAVDLDPGLYHVIIKKLLGKNALGRLSQLRWEERFFHDITPEEFAVLGAMRPTNCTARIISDGGWTYFCGYSGCDYSCNSTIAMVLHEMEHKGQSRSDLIENSDYLLDQNASEAAAAEDSRKKPARGRAINTDSVPLG